MDIYQQLKSYTGQLNYVQSCLRDDTLQDWERKEYEALDAQYTERTYASTASRAELLRLLELAEGSLVVPVDSSPIPGLWSGHELGSFRPPSQRCAANLPRRAAQVLAPADRRQAACAQASSEE